MAGAAGATSLTQAIAGLAPGTTYYARAVLASAAGEVAGAVVSFATPLSDVRAATGAATPSGRTSARLTGTVTAGAAVTYRFEYGTTTRYGRSTPTRRLDATTGPVTVALQATGLQPGRVYHYRLVVNGPGGAVRGADRTIVVGQAALRVRRAPTVGPGCASRCACPARARDGRRHRPLGRPPVTLGRARAATRRGGAAHPSSCASSKASARRAQRPRARSTSRSRSRRPATARPRAAPCRSSTAQL